LEEITMNDDTKKPEDQNELSRRDFVAMGIAAGIVAAAGGASAADMQVVEKDVEITTPDGTCNAAFIHPTTGSHPAVLIWADAFGLRPALRDMGKRLAAQGYTVLVPNPFYRVTKDPKIDTATFDFAKNRDVIQPLMNSITADGAAEKDAVAFIAWLDQQKEVNKSKKIGTQGYCMGGPLVMRTAASSARIGAGGSFHGGGLVTNNPNSPHLLAPKIHARMYFGVAKNDDERQPDGKDKLKAALDAAHVANKIEVYPANHGWCMPDMPAPANAPIYSKPDAERAWGELLALYKQALA
jgi:carboxymethylenebutenolidase